MFIGFFGFYLVFMDFRGVRNCLVRVFNGEFRVFGEIVGNIVNKRFLLTETLVMDFREWLESLLDSR